MAEPQGAHALPGILASIVETKRRELDALLGRRRELGREALDAPRPRDFGGALREGAHVSVIAECKRRSPGAGEIRPGLDPAALARTYEAAGAKALSVLTDERYFGGSLEDLGAARAATTLPVLRKDFTLDPLHVLEARAAGADAVLLIVRILSDEALGSLLSLAGDLGMSALVEAHDEVEVERALAAGATLLGINTRDLATFGTDLGTTVSLLGGVGPDVTVVSESGIRSPGDVARLAEAGVDAVLVGE
ncbi:MAG: indole-3-glycerol phosphate synthase TrpC, partial [Gemmatimonadetes bacterium]|nr:indole-3-glycerol phosphate synthase TrpC [Gemmatimonadota bacterium]